MGTVWIPTQFVNFSAAAEPLTGKLESGNLQPHNFLGRRRMGRKGFVLPSLPRALIKMRVEIIESRELPHSSSCGGDQR